VYALTAAMLGVLIYELVLNNREQGSPISLKVCASIMFILCLNTVSQPWIASTANSQSNAGTLVKRVGLPWSPIPSLYETGGCHRSF
jgi:hypothetical protein